MNKEKEIEYSRVLLQISYGPHGITFWIDTSLETSQLMMLRTATELLQDRIMYLLEQALERENQDD